MNALADGSGPSKNRCRIAVVIGTRPEAIKLMPVVHALRSLGCEPDVFVTGRHDEMLSPILIELGIRETENLRLMEAGQSLADLSARVLTSMRDLLARRRPSIVVIEGDTTSVAMTALACFYENVRVAHVEAGLRTAMRRDPFPEEMNQRLVACLADVQFAPTPAARDNLLGEGVDPASIHLVGNTVVDALFHAKNHLVGALPPDPELDEARAQGRAIVLVTAHRRESFGAGMEGIFGGVRMIAEAGAGQVVVVFPVHLNPNVQLAARRILHGVPGVRLLPPVSYVPFVRFLLAARLVVTDSGGVQEEAATLGIPVLVARRTSERMEAVEAGVSEVVGTDPRRIFEAADLLLRDEGEYRRRAVPTGAFGDGRAAERIAAVLAEETL